MQVSHPPVGLLLEEIETLGRQGFQGCQEGAAIQAPQLGRYDDIVAVDAVESVGIEIASGHPVDRLLRKVSVARLGTAW